MEKRIIRSFASVIGIVILAALSHFPCQAADLKIYCIDVNQGSATLIVAPNGKSLLIDCGAQSTWESVRIIIAETAGLSSLDYFVCTYYHDDHYGALKKLVDSGISINAIFYDRDSEKWLTDSRKESGVYKNFGAISEGKREPLRPGNKIDLDPTVDIDSEVANGRSKSLMRASFLAVSIRRASIPEKPPVRGCKPVLHCSTSFGLTRAWMQIGIQTSIWMGKIIKLGIPSARETLERSSYLVRTSNYEAGFVEGQAARECLIQR